METESVIAQAGLAVEAPGLFSSTAPAAPTNDLGKDEFLQLLVAQLRYQDPLNPSSSDDFMATTAQFTVVEKLDELTKQGENSALVNSLTTASSLIGREVTANRNGVEVTAVVERSQILNGEVELVTKLGSMGLDQIVSVAAPTATEPLAATPATAVTPVPETTGPGEVAAGTPAGEPDGDEIVSVDESEAVVQRSEEAVAVGEIAESAVDGEQLDGAALPPIEPPAVDPDFADPTELRPEAAAAGDPVAPADASPELVPTRDIAAEAVNEASVTETTQLEPEAVVETAQPEAALSEGVQSEENRSQPAETELVSAETTQPETTQVDGEDPPAISDDLAEPVDQIRSVDATFGPDPVPEVSEAVDAEPEVDLNLEPVEGSEAEPTVNPIDPLDPIDPVDQFELS